MLSKNHLHSLIRTPIYIPPVLFFQISLPAVCMHFGGRYVRTRKSSTACLKPSRLTSVVSIVSMLVILGNFFKPPYRLHKDSKRVLIMIPHSTVTCGAPDHSETLDRQTGEQFILELSSERRRRGVTITFPL